MSWVQIPSPTPPHDDLTSYYNSTIGSAGHRYPEMVLHSHKSNGDQCGICNYRQGPGDNPEGHSRASPVETWGSGQVLCASRWQRGSLTKAPCVGLTRHRQIQASTASDNRGDD